jgi:GR25 family glycosyltransferase involved in LPS biosynthesis
MKGYVITITGLKESVDGANHLIDSGKKFGFSDIEIFDAITPKKDNPKEIFKKEKLNPSEFLSNTYSRLQPLMCCFLSHYFLWKKCIELNETIAIFEHDAVFVRNFDMNFSQNIILGCSIGKPSFGNFKTSTKKGIQSLFSKQFFPGAHSYIVTPKGAKTFIEFARKHRPKPTDVFLNKKDFSQLQEYHPWITEVQESFSTVQEEKGCIAKHAYKQNKNDYKIIEV